MAKGANSQPPVSGSQGDDRSKGDNQYSICFSGRWGQNETIPDLQNVECKVRYQQFIYH